MHVLNFSVSPRLGFPPALIFGGFSTINNLSCIFNSDSQSFRNSNLTFDELTKSVQELRESLDHLHQKVKETSSRRGNYVMIRQRPNFDVGDYVMFATRRNIQGSSRKSKPRWTGPYRVISCESDCDFIIEHLVTNGKFHAHASRLKYYCDSDLEITADLKYQITHDEMRYKVEKILGHQINSDGMIQLKIQWPGFDPEDASLEPFNILYEDAPELVPNYVQIIILTDKLKSRMQALLV